MNFVTKILACKEDTEVLGEELARKLQDKPCLILLFGDVGAGKTTLTASLISQLLASKEAILSPTFSYMNHYQGVVPIYHFDLYRIEDESELFELGLMEYLSDATALRIVEWPEKAPSLQAKADIIIRLESAECGRIAKITSAIDAIA